MRKTFNFYRSYWDVANELNDKDRLAFYDALMKRQFTGVETDLGGMVKFAYLSQKHSIDRQIEGYENKTKEPLQDPTEGGTQGGMEAPMVQLKEKEKEKEEYIPTLDDFINYAVSKISNINKDDVSLKYMSWLENDWSTNVNGKQRKIKNWKSTLLNTLPYIRKDELKIYKPNIIHE